MENCFVVGLSFTSIRKKMGAQCAWVDATNMATLPPIVNPMKNSDLDGEIWAKIGDFGHVFGGYVKEIAHDDDVVSIKMCANCVLQRAMPNVAEFIEEFVVSSVLGELYSTQVQAKAVSERYEHAAKRLESALKQVLCRDDDVIDCL